MGQSLIFTQAELTALAERILELGPGPAPRLRVLRDLLNRPPGDPELRAAEQELHNSRRVRELLCDLGKGTGHWDDLPLSESWRRIDNRVIDSSVKVLCLMRRYFAPQDR